MQLTINGLKERDLWEKAGFDLPPYDVEKIQEETQKSPRWVHFGIGNIFRIFIGGIADDLIRQKVLNSGITCAEAFDFDIVDKIYRPHDNLAIGLTLYGNGTEDKKVIASLGEAVKACFSDEEQWSRLKDIFRSPSLQLVSFTITEKGYNLKDAGGEYLSSVKKDIQTGPDKAINVMSIITSMLNVRYQAGSLPLTLVSMDNCSHNGQRLEDAVMMIASEWKEKGYVSEGFIAYLNDRTKITFPWTMIDKITPRPSKAFADKLEACGLEGMQPIITEKKTYIAPFSNAEKPQYLVIEDSFMNGRPEFEKAGVYMTDRETVNKCERMKVNTCLNPIHTALAPYGCVLGYDLFADEMSDPELSRLAQLVGPIEGMKVVENPGIISPEAFIHEVLYDRFPNRYLGDTPQRIAVDTSQMVGIRFGETIKSYVAKYGSATELNGIPLAIAGWLRYLLAVTDDGKKFQLSPDPMNEELTRMFSVFKIGQPQLVKEQLRPLLSNVNIWGCNLYKVGLGKKIEQLFREEIAGYGAVRSTLKIHLDELWTK